MINSEGAAVPQADVTGRHKRLVARTVLISVFTAISRSLGYGREALTAALFGDTSAVYDAFVTAWRVPNLFRSLMGEGAIATAMQTALTRTDAERGEEAGRKLFLAIVRTVAWISGLFAVVGIAVAWALPDRMPVTDWAWLGADPAPVRDLTARMLPFVVLACVAAVATGALHVRGRFLAPSLGPVVMNAAWIGALVWVASRHIGGLHAAAGPAEQAAMAGELALLVLGCGLLLVVVQIPSLAASGLLTRRAGTDAGPRVGASEVWAILRASAPLALGAAVYQVNVLVGGFLAEALLADGGPTALYYATRLQQLPLSLVSVAATSAVFPALTALGHLRDLPGLRKLHDETQLGVAFLAVPATVGLFVFAEPIVELCFRHGAFGDEGVARTTAALRGLTLAILPVGAAGLVARTRYALGDFAGPVRVAVAVLFLNTALNLVLVAGFGLDVGALGVAAAIAAWANLAGLLPGLRRLGLPPMGREVVRRLARITWISAVACGVSWLALAFGIGPTNPWIEVVVAILVSSVLYIGLSRAVGAPELARFWAHLRGRAR